MSYNIKNFAQTITYTVNDATANTNAVSLTLLGKSLPNYGTYFNQNFVWLLENFSSDSANPPPYAVQGQLWWDNTYKFLNVYDGSNWKTAYGNLSTLVVNSAATVGNLVTTNGVYYPNGAAYAGTFSNSNVASYLTAVNYYTNANVISYLLGNITTGNITTASGAQHIGYLTGALGANSPNSVVATSIVASSVTTNSGGQHIGYLTGALGANTPNSVVATSVTTSSGGQHIGYFTGAIGANTPNTGSFTTLATTGTASVANVVTTNGVFYPNGLAFATSSYSNANVTAYLPTYSGALNSISGISVTGAIVPTSNASVNLGDSGSQYWNNVYAVNFQGTSTTAKYADLAEKYLPDGDYEVGTVMMIGGKQEITQHDGSKVRAIGVISEYPAYKMNADQEGGVYVALKGRVPVKAVGPIQKGQALIGTAHGLAVSQSDDSQWMFAISLENHDKNTIKLIEAIIL